MSIQKQAFSNIAQSTTDGALITAVAGRRIRVLAAIISAGATLTGVTFNSKGSGAGTAISALLTAPASNILILPYNPDGWFDTNTGEGLTATTGSGSTVGIQVTAKAVV